MIVKYVGGRDGVDIAVAGDSFKCERGETIEVSDEQGASLIETKVFEASTGKPKTAVNAAESEG